MQGTNDQRLIGGVARRDSTGRYVNVQDLRFRRFVSPTPGLDSDRGEPVMYSIEASDADRGRWQGPRDSVEPDYIKLDRGTDELRTMRVGLTDEPADSFQQNHANETSHFPGSSYSSKLSKTQTLPRTSVEAQNPVSPSDSIIFLDEYPASHQEGSASGTAEMKAEEDGPSYQRAVVLCKHRCGAWFIEHHYANMHEKDFCPNKPT